ncbi:MAG: adenylyltransferase/cytidyltransferase family protein [Actinomycetota bacterium]
MTRVCYPGSFNPPTVAHLAIADRARQVVEATEVVWVVSRVALAKEHVEVPTLDERVGVLRTIADRHPWLSVEVSDSQLLADLAAGFDAIIMGADKWHQIHELRFYPDAAARDASIASLPRPLVVPRGDLPVPPEHRLDVDDTHHVSSTAAREGRRDLMLDAARAFDELTGAWSRSPRDGGDGSGAAVG